jgi:hypothetical protein
MDAYDVDGDEVLAAMARRAIDGIVNEGAPITPSFLRGLSEGEAGTSWPTCWPRPGAT